MWIIFWVESGRSIQIGSKGSCSVSSAHKNMHSAVENPEVVSAYLDIRMFRNSVVEGAVINSQMNLLMAKQIAATNSKDQKWEHQVLNKYVGETLPKVDRRVRLWTNTFQNEEFSNSRKVMNGKVIVLQENGKGKRPKKTDPLPEKEEHLWDAEVLGTSNPTSLNYFPFSQYFGTRGRRGNHQICIDNLKAVRDATTGTFPLLSELKGQQRQDKMGFTKGQDQWCRNWWGQVDPVAQSLALKPCRNASIYFAPLRKEQYGLKLTYEINQFMKV